MATFDCVRCGYQAKYKQHLQKHLNKKILCDPIVSDIDRTEALSAINVRERASRNANNKLACDYCSKEFASRGSKYQHSRNCKSKPDNTVKLLQDLQNKLANQEARIDQLQQELKATTINNTTNNITTNNCTINNNINILAFGQEDLSFLTPEFMQECVWRCQDHDVLPNDNIHGITKLIEMIHSVPQNRNVRILSKRDRLMQYKADTGNWVTDENENVLNMVLNRGVDVLVTYWREHPEIDEYEKLEGVHEDIYEHIQRLQTDNSPIRKPPKRGLYVVFVGKQISDVETGVIKAR
jgi:hypothetical protein